MSNFLLKIKNSVIAILVILNGVMGGAGCCSIALQQDMLSVLQVRAPHIKGVNLFNRFKKKQGLEFLRQCGFSEEEISKTVEQMVREQRNTDVPQDVFTHLARRFSAERNKKVMLGILAETFPLPFASKFGGINRVRDILKDGMDSNIDLNNNEHSFDVFNVTHYGSQYFYESVSNRIIHLVSEQFRLLKEQDPQDIEMWLRQLFAWLGSARAVVDVCGEEGIKELTDFGVCINEKLEGSALAEPWGTTIPIPYRVFMLKTIGQFHFGPKDKKPTNYPIVFHKDSGDLSFLQTVINALFQSDERLYDNILQFIFDFSISSTFNRGQSAIMEWIYKALAQARRVQFVLSYGTQMCARKIEDDVRELSQLCEQFPDPKFNKLLEVYASFSEVFSFNNMEENTIQQKMN